MTQSFVILAQSVTGAVITMIGLLLVAGIIGYVTAWLYAGSVYKPVIETLRKEKENLTKQVESQNRQIEVMKGEIIKLNHSLEVQDEKIKILENEIEEKNKEIKKMGPSVKEN